MSEIKIVDNSYAVIYYDKVVGVVDRCNSDGQWGFFPLCQGNKSSLWPVSLRHALEDAIKFVPEP